MYIHSGFTNVSEYVTRDYLDEVVEYLEGKISVLQEQIDYVKTAIDVINSDITELGRIVSECVKTSADLEKDSFWSDKSVITLPLNASIIIRKLISPLDEVRLLVGFNSDFGTYPGVYRFGSMNDLVSSNYSTGYSFHTYLHQGAHSVGYQIHLLNDDVKVSLTESGLYPAVKLSQVGIDSNLNMGDYMITLRNGSDIFNYISGGSMLLINTDTTQQTRVSYNGVTTT